MEDQYTHSVLTEQSTYSISGGAVVSGDAIHSKVRHVDSGQQTGGRALGGPLEEQVPGGVAV